MWGVTTKVRGWPEGPREVSGVGTWTGVGMMATSGMNVGSNSQVLGDGVNTGVRQGQCVSVGFCILKVNLDHWRLQ